MPSRGKRAVADTPASARQVRARGEGEAAEATPAIVGGGHSQPKEGVATAACSICFLHYDPGERAPLQLPCWHTFCTKCIGLLSSGECPACQKPFQVGEAKPFFVVQSKRLEGQGEFRIGLDRAAGLLSTLVPSGIQPINASRSFVQREKEASNASGSLVQGGIESSNAPGALVQGGTEASNASQSLVQGETEASNASESLVQGGTEANNASGSLVQGDTEMSEASGSLVQGGQEESNATGLVQGATEMSGASGSLVQGATETSEASGSLVQEVTEISNATGSLVQGATEMRKALGSFVQGATEISNATGSLVQGATEMRKALGSFVQGGMEMSHTTGSLVQMEMSTATGSLVQGGMEMSHASGSLVQGGMEMSNATGSLVQEGVEALAGRECVFCRLDKDVAAAATHVCKQASCGAFLCEEHGKKHREKEPDHELCDLGAALVGGVQQETVGLERDAQGRRYSQRFAIKRARRTLEARRRNQEAIRNSSANALASQLFATRTMPLTAGANPPNHATDGDTKALTALSDHQSSTTSSEKSLKPPPAPPKLTLEDSVRLAIQAAGQLTEAGVLIKVGDRRYARTVIRQLVRKKVLLRTGQGGAKDPFIYSVNPNENEICELPPDERRQMRNRKIQLDILAVVRKAGRPLTEKELSILVGQAKGLGINLRKLLRSGELLRHKNEDTKWYEYIEPDPPLYNPTPPPSEQPQETDPAAPATDPAVAAAAAAVVAATTDDAGGPPAPQQPLADSAAGLAALNPAPPLQSEVAAPSTRPTRDLAPTRAADILCELVREVQRATAHRKKTSDEGAEGY